MAKKFVKHSVMSASMNKKFTKYPINASSDASWPTSDYWDQFYGPYDGELADELVSQYFADPENNVADRLNLSYEPCREGMYVDIWYDDPAETQIIDFDWEDWFENELNLASKSNSALEYEQKFESWIRNYLRDNYNIVR